MNWITIGLLLVIALLAVWMALLGSQILGVLRQIVKLIQKWPPPRNLHPPESYIANYATWTYRDGIWEIVESRAEPGFIPGDPPRRPGSYEGETIRRPTVRNARAQV